MADYLTTNAAVSAASGSTSNRITAALGVTPANGDRVAIEGQANDVYVGAWTFSGGSWNRILFGTLISTYASSDSSSSRQLQIRRAQFGDGYVRQTPTGVGNVSEDWGIRTVPVSRRIARLLECGMIGLFAQGQAGVFAWTPPGETTAKRWMVREGTLAIEDLGNDRTVVSVNLRRTYNPAG